MDQELGLGPGAKNEKRLPEPGDFDSFYVFSMDCSGQESFWQLLARLMAEAGRPVVSVHETASECPPEPDQWLRRRGYGFGVLLDLESGFPEDLPAHCLQLVFLRNPRYMLVALHNHLLKSLADVPSSFIEFLHTPTVARAAARYRRIADRWYRKDHFRVFRYEHALSGWHSVAADLAATLRLPIDPLRIASVAAAAAPLGDRLPVPDRLSRAEIAAVETKFADVCAVFGYPRAAGPLPGTPKYRGVTAETVQRSTAAPRSQPVDPRPPRTIVAPDPVLLTRLRPNSSIEMQVLGRTVVMDVDSFGCRPVIGQPPKGEKTVAFYGCSFTYGIAIQAEETFCSLLQGMFPTWRIENHGVAGYSGARNLIQLERNTRWSQPEIVSFCWIAHHLGRNVASLPWVQVVSQGLPDSQGRLAGKQNLTRATLDPQGALQMRSVRVPRHDLVGIDLNEYIPDAYYLDLVCFRLFERAHGIVSGYGGHFFVTTLQGSLSSGLAARLAGAGIAVLDASLTGDEYLCLPDDHHPNPRANRLYAEKIGDYLRRVQQP
jgi:hypothetical protein